MVRGRNSPLSFRVPNIWFTADFHFGHTNIIRYCGRPFHTAEEMDMTILERLNALVKPNDLLYFLGDFCMGSRARIQERRRQIRCKKIFAVPGNHDKQARKLADDSLAGPLCDHVFSEGHRFLQKRILD